MDRPGCGHLDILVIWPSGREYIHRPADGVLGVALKMGYDVTEESG